MRKIFLILGILGILLGGVVTIGSLALPAITRNVSTSEAGIGVAAGVFIVAASFLPAIAGIIILIVRSKKGVTQ